MSDSSSPYSWTRPPGRAGVRKADARAPAPGAVDASPDDEIMSRAAQSSHAEFMENAAPVHAGCCIHAVNGVELVADPQGVAYWPGEDTLLVADLHLEKGSSFARRGQMLPPYDTMVTLRRLAACIEKWQPGRVVALGDSFHDAEGAERLTSEALDTLRRMMAGRDWVWITGNHDPLPPKGLEGDVMEVLHEGGLILRHEPLVYEAPADGAAEIAGHLHPKARLMRRGLSIRRSCFAASRHRMIMPSFGAYTGGLSVFDPAFRGLFDGRNFHALMRGDDAVHRIPASALG